MIDPEVVAKRMLLNGPHRYNIPAEFILTLIDRVEPLFRREPTLIRLHSPIFAVGDLHGQYSDLLRVFKRCGLPFSGEKFLFLGDIVDRGKHSLECLVLLLCLKAKFPKHILIIRGNHEIPSVNKTYGFYGELRQRYARTGEWQLIYDRINRLFSYLPLSALINSKILCLHGGLSPELTSLSQIEAIRRPLYEPSGLAECLLWSDPDSECNGFATNKSRGVAYIFGKDAVVEKCKKLGVEKIIRGHQLVDYGFDTFADGKVITIFTASSYHETINNYGGIAAIDRNGNIEILQLSPQYPMTDDETSDPIEG
uniref:Serine/threonine-protein phosphatase n=1 Tax=Panagrolaimus superbus TaxID=310955 RepID=A0A914XXZ8_9BILA